MNTVHCDDCGGLLFRTFAATEEDRLAVNANPCTCKPMKDCICPESAAGWKALNAQISSAIAHGVGYGGPIFKFCPWCGAPREREL